MSPMDDPHCAGCGAITSIPPLCGHCFGTISVRSPIVASSLAGYDFAVRIEGCVQHLTREGLTTFVRNTREFAAPRKLLAPFSTCEPPYRPGTCEEWPSR